MHKSQWSFIHIKAGDYAGEALSDCNSGQREDERIVYHVMPTSGLLKSSTSAMGGRLLSRSSGVTKCATVKWTLRHRSGGNTSRINSHWVAECQAGLRLADGLVTKKTSSRQDTSP